MVRERKRRMRGIERLRNTERQTRCHSGKVTGGKVKRGVLGEKTKIFG